MPLLEKLRDEVIEVQRAQAAIAHWKLLLIATLGAAGLGLVPSCRPSNHHILILGLLPLVCSYADALAYNSGIRALSIARYLRVRTRVDAEAPDAFTEAKHYELYAAQHRPSFDLEVVALRWTSVLISLCVAALGGLVWIWPDLYSLNERSITVRIVVGAWLLTCGLFGAFLACELSYRHQRNVRRFDGRARRTRRRLAGWAVHWRTRRATRRRK